jgi:hypothetical protein
VVRKLRRLKEEEGVEEEEEEVVVEVEGERVVEEETAKGRPAGQVCTTGRAGAAGNDLKISSSIQVFFVPTPTGGKAALKLHQRLRSRSADALRIELS